MASRNAPAPDSSHRSAHRREPASERTSAHTPALALQLLDAAQCVQAVVHQGRSLTDALAKVLPASRPAAQALSFHTLRRLAAVQAVLERLAPKPPAPPLRALMSVALALLWRIEPNESLRYAPHTVVDQAVAAAHRRRWPEGFVNASLRRYLREEASLRASLQTEPTITHNLPAWWWAELQRDWPDAAQALARAARLPPPMTLRVNQRRYTVDAYLARLRALGLDGQPLGGDAVWLAEPVPVEKLPGFAEGLVSVQDASAQQAASVLTEALRRSGALAPLAREKAHSMSEPSPARLRVLDACAAPGGKTAHLLEALDLDLLALDIDATRVQRIQDTLTRLGLTADVRVADAGRPESWWDGKPFDAILLDAPCSGSGVLRRHPDIAWLRRRDDLPQLARQQDRLLEALWPLLAAGGQLLYATCSVFRVEGEQRIDAFLQRHPDAMLDPKGLAPGHLLGLAENGSDRFATGDGFFYALLQRPASTTTALDASPSSTASTETAAAQDRGTAVRRAALG